MSKKIINLVFLLILLITMTGSTIVQRQILDKVICIDPGHGGIDCGAIGNDGTYEKDINLSIALKISNILTKQGYNVILTRDGDYDLAKKESNNRKREDILQRVNLINNSNCLLYISIHSNSYPQSNARGAQVFYNLASAESLTLAKTIQEKIKQTLLNTERTVSAIKDKYLIDNSQTTGCLVEVGFLSNSQELTLLKSEDYQMKLAEAIVLGTIEYLNK